MTASTRRELRSAATSTSTTAIGLIRALTDARPIKPTSTRCLSARRPNPAEAPLIDAEILFRQPQPPQLSRNETNPQLVGCDQRRRHFKDERFAASPLWLRGLRHRQQQHHQRRLHRDGRFKVFRGQNDAWLEEYRLYHRDGDGRVVKENDDAISASRYGIMMRRFGRAGDWDFHRP